MSYIEYPITYTSVFCNFNLEDRREMETNAMSLATDDHGQLPYEIEVFITPGVLNNLFDIKKQSNFMTRIVVFSSESQKAAYIAKRELRYSQSSINITSKPNQDEDYEDQA